MNFGHVHPVGKLVTNGNINNGNQGRHKGLTPRTKRSLPYLTDTTKIESEGQPSANLKETQLANLKVGQKATVVSDIYPDVVWRATVSAIAPATGAEFAVLPPQNATGNWVKVVQRIPVLIQVEPGDTALRVGMTVSVSVDTQRERGLPRSVQRLIDSGWLPRRTSFPHS